MRPSHTPKIVLIGNRLVGKSTLFTALTGRDPGETDLAGSTMEITSGKLALASGEAHIIDTPGINTLFSQDEAGHQTREFLVTEAFDAILLVMDTKNPKRSLALFYQLSLLQKPMVCALNMADEAKKAGIKSDLTNLKGHLTVPVVMTNAQGGDGVESLRRLLDAPVIPKVDPFTLYLNDVTSLARERSLNRADTLLSILTFAHLPEAEATLARRHPELAKQLILLRAREGRKTPMNRMDLTLTDTTFTIATRVAREAFWEATTQQGLAGRLGRWSMRPGTGIPIAFLMLFLMYLWVGKFGATWLVDTIDQQLFAKYFLPFMQRVVSYIPWALVRDALMDPEFGVITTGLFLALGIVLPVLFTYYLFVGLLEESGYFPRLSVLLDRVMRPLGLNGRGVMPLLMGFSCITMAIVTTRVLRTRKERIIATLLLILGVPCAPLMATMFIILGKLHWSATLLIFGVIFSQIILAGVLANRLIKGELPEFIMEIPPLRAPRPLRVLKKTLLRTLEFIREALPLFVFASFVLFVLARLGMLTWIEYSARPLVENFWGLPRESVQVLIKTMIRRENGVAELARLRHLFTGAQAIIIMLLMTFLLPCVNATLMMIKERGLKIALGIIGTVFVYATLVAGAMNFLFHLFGVRY